MHKRLKELVHQSSLMLLVGSLVGTAYFVPVKAQQCGNGFIEGAEECDGGYLGFQKDLIVSPEGAGISGAKSMTLGPDGNLYIATYDSTSIESRVLQYNPTTGDFVGVFVDTNEGGLENPAEIAFGPDGNLYVSSYSTDEILRYDSDGVADVAPFVPSGGLDGLDGPYGLSFGPDGNLYVSSFLSSEILRYDGQTGDWMDTAGFASTDLVNPRRLLFGPDNNLYVATFSGGEVLRYDGSTGELIDHFVKSGTGGLAQPTSLDFGPDGDLYVGGLSTGAILRYDGETGGFVNTLDFGVRPLDSLVFNGLLYVLDSRSTSEVITTYVLEAGNSNQPNAQCRLDCTLPSCGDGILDDSLGEACDDGNLDEGDGCDSICHVEVPPDQGTDPTSDPEPSQSSEASGGCSLNSSSGSFTFLTYGCLLISLGMFFLKRLSHSNPNKKS
ncbi:MAG: DUF4215 domain-containing protein [Deltaproteobacteria bacterium]|nr:DUF4215 domain-containing protein [Deltaproteobacteria bacterium]